MGKRTPLFALHQAANAKIVEFSGWEMPLHYGSQIEEHHTVRQNAGVFDVSHMGVVDLKGNDAQSYLRRLLANDVAKLSPGKALYTCMLNESGGILDDLIVYKVAEDYFRIVVNAGTREKDFNWMVEHQLPTERVVLQERNDLSMLAIQGPQVKQLIAKFLPAALVPAVLQLKPFHFISSDDLFVARTGYTGEDGYEIILPAIEAPNMWQKIVSAGIAPCGLGSRDTLRLEAGLNLYGADMDENVNPYVSNLGWTVAMEPKDREFIGRAALESYLQNSQRMHLVGLVLMGQGVMRNHQKILIEGLEAGEVTSGGYSPTLAKSIALARLKHDDTHTECQVLIRNKAVPASIVKPPFVRQGKKMF